jgi:uncharacterized protein YndB with AHSA1/START domain
VAHVRVSRVIPASPRDVWRVVADINGHARWQVDVRAIEFTTSDQRGVGAQYICDTRLGPIRMRIPMTVTEWRERKAVAVRYQGRLSGGGRITLRRRRRGATKVTWSAQIRLPWLLGGPVGALVAAQPLRLVWRRNLANLERDLVRLA